MAKSTKLNRSQKIMIWRLTQKKLTAPEISDKVGAARTRVAQYMHKKFKEEADLLWAEKIREHGWCEVCETSGVENKYNLQAHHLLKKSIRPHLRYDLMNGLCICADHHEFNIQISPHSGQVAIDNFTEWLEDYRGEQYEYFKKHKIDKAYQDFDYETEYWKLRGEL